MALLGEPWAIDARSSSSDGFRLQLETPYSGTIATESESCRSSKAFVKFRASFGAKITLIVLRALRVIGKRDDDADQPPVLVVEEG